MTEPDLDDLLTPAPLSDEERLQRIARKVSQGYGMFHRGMRPDESPIDFLERVVFSKPVDPIIDLKAEPVFEKGVLVGFSFPIPD
jgi:hypothetical protein